MSEERVFITKKMSTGRKVKMQVFEKDDGTLEIKILGDGFRVAGSPEYKEALSAALQLAEIIKKSGVKG